MELFRALAALVEPPGAETARVAAALELGPAPDPAAHTELFAFQLYPYASVYLGAEGMLGGEARDRVAGFWRALGQQPPAEPDHLATLLALYARLQELAAHEPAATPRRNWQHAGKVLLWEHLLSWLPAYLDKLHDLAPVFYQRWAELLLAALLAEARQTGPPAVLPLHLRAAPALVDPRTTTAAEFVQALISPARSGLLLTRADLLRAGRQLKLGGRVGERRYMLEALFNQAAPAVLDWLAVEAADWQLRHQKHAAGLGPIATAWAAKAAATAALLTELGRVARAADGALATDAAQ